MSDRGTAGEQLERILYLLPLAAREGGVSLGDAAERLGVSVGTIQGDLEAMTARAFYHPAGGADEIQILLEKDRIKIYSHKKFHRPHKLSRREALVLAIGLRRRANEARLAGDPPAHVDEIRDLAVRVEMELAVASAGDESERFAIDEGDDEGAGLRARLTQAAAAHVRVRIRYLKPGAGQPEDRRVDPYAVVYGSGRWYVIGHCRERDGIRSFRIDRILEADLTGETFPEPADFSVADYSYRGRVFQSDASEEITVRYSPLVAGWVRESGPVDEAEGGAVQVTYSAADAGWVVRHALSYGPEAEIVRPPSVRAMLISAARAVGGTGAPGGPRPPG